MCKLAFKCYTNQNNGLLLYDDPITVTVSAHWTKKEVFNSAQLWHLCVSVVVMRKDGTFPRLTGGSGMWGSRQILPGSVWPPQYHIQPHGFPNPGAAWGIWSFSISSLLPQAHGFQTLLLDIFLGYLEEEPSPVPVFVWIYGAWGMIGLNFLSSCSRASGNSCFSPTYIQQHK